MRFFSRWPIQLQLLLSLGGSIALVFSISVFYNYQVSKQQLITESRLLVKDTVIGVFQEFTTMIDGVENSTQLLANVVTHTKKNDLQLQDLLQHTILTNTNIYGGTIALSPKFSSADNGFAPYYYRDGDSVAYVNLATKNYDYSHKEWFSKAKELRQPSWSEPYFDDSGGNTLMTTFSTPVMRNNEIYAVVTGDLSLNSIHRSIQGVHLGETGQLILLDNSLNIISSPNQDDIMRSFTSTLGGLANTTGWLGVLERLQQDENGYINQRCPHVDGACLIAFRKLPLTQWPLLVIYPEKEMFSNVDDFTIKFAFISLALLVVTLLLIALVTRHLTRPLESLAAAADEVGKGNFDVTLHETSGNAESTKLLQTFKRMQQQLQLYINRLKDETASRNRIEGEMSAATQIQMSMLPGTDGMANIQTSDFDLWAQVIPAKSVGGDLYQYHLFEDDKLLFIVGDVSDKGVAAALFMASTVSIFNQAINHRSNPAELLQYLNEALVKNNDACMFVTVFSGLLNLKTGEFIFASAGHNPAMIIQSSKASELTQVHGTALGLIEGIVYENNAVTLQPKDKLFVFTDGIDEAFNLQGDMYGAERLQKLLTEYSFTSAEKLGHAAFDAVSCFSRGIEQSDDIGVMCIEYKPVVDFLITDVKPEFCHSIVIAAEISAITALLETLEHIEKQQQLNLEDARLICEEVVVNAISYGETQNTEIQIYLGFLDGQLLIEVIDQGKAYNPLVEALEPDLNGLSPDEDIIIGGFGVHLIKSLSVKQIYARKAAYNHLCLLMNIPR